MPADTLKIIRNGTNGNILFIGKNTALMENFMNQIVQSYSMATCLAMDLEIERALNNFKPNAVVVFLTDESSIAMNAYATLSSKPEYINIPVLVIGKQAECDIFKNAVFSNHIEYFKRPIDSEFFIGRLDECVNDFMTYTKDKLEEVEPSTDRSIGIGDDGDIDKLLSVDKSLMNRIKHLTFGMDRKTILVVDDDVRMLNIIKLYLQEIYDVVVVPSGKLAIKYLAKKTADLVLLDYMMPEMDGPSVLKVIRDESPCPSVPVIFLTGVSDKDMVMRGIELKPRGYMLKPVSREDLLEKVTEVVLGL